MSSMRNAVQRRPHRERAQPLERRRLGLLEKHKDYSLRAKDYNKKQETLKNLRAKAADRNEDEFYYGMMSRQGPGNKIKEGKTWNGMVKGDRGNKVMNVDTVRLLKTQDIGYVRTMRQVARKEVSKLEERLALLQGLDHLEDDDDDMDDDDDDDDFDMPPKSMRPKASRKIVFVDDEDEREEALERMEDEEDEKPEVNKETQAQRDEDLEEVKRQLKSARNKLQVLNEAHQELEIQRKKMAKTATSGGTTRRGEKIKVRTRKR